MYNSVCIIHYSSSNTITSIGSYLINNHSLIVFDYAITTRKYYPQILPTITTHKYYPQILPTNTTHIYYPHILPTITTHKYYPLPHTYMHPSRWTIVNNMLVALWHSSHRFRCSNCGNQKCILNYVVVVCVRGQCTIVPVYHVYCSVVFVELISQNERQRWWLQWYDQFNIMRMPTAQL